MTSRELIERKIVELATAPAGTGMRVKQVEKSGQFEVVFATMNVPDKHGDVTEPGFFGEQPALTIANHDMYAADAVPLAKGMTSEQGDEAIFSGTFNTDIPLAKAWHDAILFDLNEGPRPLQEWSYVWEFNPGGFQFREDEDGDLRRFLIPLPDGSPGAKMHSVDPVLIGAGIDTRTIAAKATDTPERGGRLKFLDEVAQSLAAAESVINRAEAIAKLRSEKHQQLGDAALAGLNDLAAEYNKAHQRLTDLAEQNRHSDDMPDQQAGDMIWAELAKFEAHKARMRDLTVRLDA